MVDSVEKICEEIRCDWGLGAGSRQASVRHGVGDVVEHDAKGEA